MEKLTRSKHQNCTTAVAFSKRAEKWHHYRLLQGSDERQRPLGVVSNTRVSMLPRKHLFLPYFICTFGNISIQHTFQSIRYIFFQSVRSLGIQRVILALLVSCSAKCATGAFFKLKCFQQVNKRRFSIRCTAKALSRYNKKRFACYLLLKNLQVVCCLWSRLCLSVCFVWTLWGNIKACQNKFQSLNYLRQLEQ